MNEHLFAKDYEWLLRAARIAETHDSGGRVRAVCLVVKNGKLLGTGLNSYTRGGGTLHEDYEACGVHAELDALSSTDARGATLYVITATPQKLMACSKPCRRCTRLIKNSTVRYVVYVEMSGQVTKRKRIHL